MKNIVMRIGAIFMLVIILFANFSFVFATNDEIETVTNIENGVTKSEEREDTVSSSDNVEDSEITIAPANWQIGLLFGGPAYALIGELEMIVKTSKRIEEVKDTLDLREVAEKVISIYFLRFGDYADKFLRQTLGEEITIDKIVFNKVDMLNPNFFLKSTNHASNNASRIIRKVINQWFQYFRKITIVVILASIILAGIRILLQTPQAKVKAYDSLKKIVLAVALVYFFPYVMRFAFDINEAIIGYINEENNYGIVRSYTISPDYDEDSLEFRSPKYVSTEGTMNYSLSSYNTQLYLEKIQEYLKNVDVMHLIRAFAGVTYRFAYVIIWYVMLAQVYILTFIYLKRYLTIAFLIIIYPLVVAGYVIDGVSGKRKGAFNTWCKKFFSTIFLQTLHAVMYGIISGILVSQIIDTSGGTAPGRQKINIILTIVATSFLFSGEKILQKFWENATDSSADRKGLKAAFGMPRKVFKNFKK